ncbi:hypothetical protein P43SY_000707 [Pythium insidiosum]|uniref:EGF-like domain-containing protein n=1 Tax=Pythium insidiosum TaxID=114742 RepID=A0AAD5LSB5_PYTIN|nr:hypothetical protein P43SY_000707 [Pythium insidiosum]
MRRVLLLQSLLALALSALSLPSLAVADDAVAALEAQCSRFASAENASVVLRWELLDGAASSSSTIYTRISHTSVALSAPDRLLIIGGIEFESAQPVVVNTTLVYLPATDVFLLPRDQILSAAAPATATPADDVFVSPASRAEHAVFAFQNVVFLFGGQNKELLGDTWRLCVAADSATATWDELVVAAADATSRLAAPAPRVGHSFSLVFENASHVGAVVFGGLSESYVELGGLHLALIAKSSATACADRSPRVHWRQLSASGPDSPLPRAYHGATAVSRRFTPQRLACLLVFGGRNTQQNLILGDLWRLCPSASSSGGAVEAQLYAWERLEPMGNHSPGPRFGITLVLVDEGKVALAGGSYTFPNDFLSDTWEFNANASQWLALRFEQDFTPPRRGHSLTLLSPNRLYLFGGRDRYAVVTRRLQIARYSAPFCAPGLKITLCVATAAYVCVPCPAGFFLESGTRRCLPCAPGSFSAEGAAACTACPAGTFNALSGQSSIAACLQCPAGSSSAVVGASSAAVCVPCAPGTFSATNGAAACERCAPGTFSSGNAVACESCPPGTRTSVGEAVCRACDAGTYSPLRGNAGCFACPQGFVSDAGASACWPCPVNTFGPSVAAAACVACPRGSFALKRGQPSCSTCPAGATLGASGDCEPCPVGTFSTGDGVCRECPQHSFGDAPGLTACKPCPAGLRTASTGATSPAACGPCPPLIDDATGDSLGQVFNGKDCAPCPSGTVFFSSSSSSTPTCERCLPGSFCESSSASALCPAMSVTASTDESGCASCPSGSFAMTGWSACVPCAASFRGECPVGRNSFECSNRGSCVLRTCLCQDGWTGSDCSSDVRPTFPFAMLSHVFIPQFDLQARVIPTRGTPSRDAPDVFHVRVARSGARDVPLRVLLAVRATGTNVTRVSDDAAFPRDVVIPIGSRETSVTFSTALFASSVVGTKCRALTLELVEFYNGLRLVTYSAERSITLFFDDMNGVGLATARRDEVASYTPRQTVTSVVDRVVATRLTLLPAATTQLAALPLSLRVAVDSPVPGDVVALLPAVLAQLQTAYPAGIRAGFIRPNATAGAHQVYAESLSDFFDDAEAWAATAAPSSFPLTWLELAAALRATDANAWTREDGAVRRTLLVFFRDAATLAAPNAFAAIQDLLVARAVLVVAVLPVGVSLSANATATLPPSSLVEIVTTPVGLADMPLRVATALQARDASLSGVRASVLSDVAALVAPSTPIAITLDSATRLPRLEVSLQSLPSSLSSAAVTLSVPGFFLLSLSLEEPGPSCFAPPSVQASLPIASNEDAMSGWVGTWRGLTPSEWQRQGWAVSPSLTTVTLTEDASLLRSHRTTVLRLTPSSTSVSISRAFGGREVPKGMSLVLRGFVRHVVTNAALLGDEDDDIVATCVARLELDPSASGAAATTSTYTATTQRREEWTPVLLSVAVRSDLDLVKLTLSCSLDIPSGSRLLPAVEWTSVGLVPDPAMACQCPPGWFFGDNGGCQRCPAGFYCVAGLRRPCAIGTFSFGEAFRCEPCRDGWICVDGLVRLCEPGTYAVADGRTCALCPRGYACRNGKRQLCPAGRFSLDGARECEICPPGTVSTTSGYESGPCT